jgi:hypothetical protein
VAVFLVAATGRAGHALPAWLTWSGMVIGAAGVLSMSSLVAAGGSVFIPIGRFLGFAWFVALSVSLWRHDGRTGNLPGAGVPRHP